MMCSTPATFSLFRASIFADCSAMASGHQDVDLPRSTLHKAGSFLSEFEEWLVALGYTTWRVQKEQGNHLTDFLVYCFMGNSAPSKKNKVQFGCTRFAAKNPQAQFQISSLGTSECVLLLLAP
jgi:hypothetical protein